ncbi:hypothetical protein EYF80_048824 [Liparis tanakae]|uniref:Uncharacterized protein n=1 Tax=Liparis tanakae TaxID=230148 RepID=A0A4Z2FIN7_9TELE|nr:hypothetical protein EYF80_048824 [Liparis tanakae]
MEQWRVEAWRRVKKGEDEGGRVRMRMGKMGRMEENGATQLEPPEALPQGEPPEALPQGERAGRPDVGLSY